MNPGEKACAECGEVRPNDPMHFPMYRKQCSACLACVTKARRRKQEEKAEYRARRLSRMEGKAADLLIKAQAAGGGNIPHSAELLEQLMVFFGGVNGFSSMLLKQYLDAKPGSPTRTRMLEMITRLVTANAALGGSKKPLTMWSEDELNEELDARLADAVTGHIPAAPKLLEVEISATPAEHQAG